jgi:hypothetical protein
MEKKEDMTRTSGLTVFCIMLILGSFGGSVALPLFILGFEGPLIFLPFVEGLFIYNFYLAYNIWNLKKKSWILVKIWLLILFLFVTSPTILAAINNASESALYTLLMVSFEGYFVIAIFGYYLYKKRHLFVR